MKTIYVLVILYYNGGAMNIETASEEACASARAQFIESLRATKFPGNIFAECIEVEVP